MCQLSKRFLPGLGKAAIIIDFIDDYYRIAVHADTNSKVSMFYKFKYKGEVEPYPLKPRQVTITEKKGEKKIQLPFPDQARVESIETHSVGGTQKSVTEKSATSKSFIIAPFSVVFLVRHLDWQLGMTEFFDIFTGKKPYELKLICNSVTTKTIGTNKEAWGIIPVLRDLSRKENKETTRI